MSVIEISIYRYNPETDQKPRMQDYQLNRADFFGEMLLDALIALKAQDDSLSFRRSCGEGVCGSDAMNINGKNGLACITPLKSLEGKKIVLRPLPGMPVVRDLAVDLTRFYEQYKKIKPYLQNTEQQPAKERLQSPQERKKLDGLYECILCACCSSSCPSYWWNPDKFIGPASSLQSARFILDSRDTQKASRLSQLEDSYTILRCRGIMSCVSVCPKGLNPTKAITDIKDQLLNDSV